MIFWDVRCDQLELRWTAYPRWMRCRRCHSDHLELAWIGRDNLCGDCAQVFMDAQEKVLTA